jgi:hypothetical protein
MGFQPDLDVSDFIDDYAAWFDGTGEVEQRVDTNATMNFEQPITAETTKVTFGPTTCSSCTDLDISPRIIWDNNYYYRSLGVDPRATKAQLREAFHAVNGGESEFLTYVLQQLLNPETRRMYDCLPLGEPLIDKFMSLAIKKAALQEAIRRSLQDGEPADAMKIMDEMGYKVVQHPADEPHSVGRPGQTFADEWLYSYYLHKVRCYDTGILRDWQHLLVSALSEAGVTMQFAVGFTSQGDTQAKAFTRTEEASIVVAYLGATTKPTRELASQIARTLTTQ